MFKVERLNKSFDGLTAISDVSFEVTPQTITSVIGPNGAGKSTLFNLITGLFAPSSGKVFLKGEDITRLSIDARVRRGIGKSFQIVNLFPGLTVREHVLMAINKNCMKLRYSKLEIEESNHILTTLGMVDKADMVVRNLPLSEQRRLDAGLLLALGCDLLLFDEPFAGLAANQIADFKGLLLQFAEAKTILLIEHRLSIVMELASRVIVMARGKIVADGSPDEIRQNNLVKQSYLREEYYDA